MKPPKSTRVKKEVEAFAVVHHSSVVGTWENLCFIFGKDEKPFAIYLFEDWAKNVAARNTKYTTVVPCTISFSLPKHLPNKRKK